MYLRPAVEKSSNKSTLEECCLMPCFLCLGFSCHMLATGILHPTSWESTHSRPSWNPSLTYSKSNNPNPPKQSIQPPAILSLHHPPFGINITLDGGWMVTHLRPSFPRQGAQRNRLNLEPGGATISPPFTEATIPSTSWEQKNSSDESGGVESVA